MPSQAGKIGPDLLTKRPRLLCVAASFSRALPRLQPTSGGSMTSREQHDRMANAIRFLSMDAVEKANSGHPGLPMGCADIATVLFSR
ncbi:MAG: hypothetical protein E5X77_29580, partial [Mesorhizobium sp.]